MKSFSFALRMISGSLVVLAALIFTVIEVTLLVTLDFYLYENEFIAFVQLILKLSLALSAGTLGVLSLVKMNRSFLTESVCLLLSSAVMIPFISNGFGIFITAVSALFVFSNVCSRL